ncbi:type III pantothenate kinase [Muriicola sp. Z0-33]|uniref:type III pantothenate kinase n=1 Tax=Muriicola sp. Z0-33 TaxID=2816957 RepID=UPI0022387E2A|nr:type III pantothenate kinase [Muriicola sp. Z0-33]MCW5515131.1 type III pantothenate kinase [Muriicola sp. Z0-33]
MNLIIDVGNTLLKIAVFDKSRMIFIEKKAINDFPESVKTLLHKYPNIKRAIVSNVGQLKKKDLDVLTIFCDVHQLSHKSRVPFKNYYATANTLGVDRIALATAAFYFNPNGNTLVIDAGSCITYDIINDSGEYLGGAISPGMDMRYKALHNQTSRLPLLQSSDLLDLIGNSTEGSIHSGVVNGICQEIDGIINQYKSRFEDLTVILTGGDAQFLSKRLKNTIFAHSNFLLEGLNYLLEYNKR